MAKSSAEPMIMNSDSPFLFEFGGCSTDSDVVTRFGTGSGLGAARLPLD